MKSKGIIFISFLILSVFIPSNIFAQDNKEEIPKEWILKLVQFRDYLLRQDEGQLYALRDLIDKWDALELTSKKQNELIVETVYGSALYEYSNRYVSKVMNKQLVKEGIDLIISEGDVELIKNNFEIIELINMGVLKGEYPFVLAKDQIILKEIMAYEFADKESVAEIGAGSGMFALLLKLFYPDMMIAVNEISSNKHKFLNIILKKHASEVNTQNYFAIKGQKKSTNLEEYLFRKVIVRRTYHHFSKKADMLASIKESMNSESRLYLLEDFKNDSNFELDCKHVLSREEIISIVTNIGFEVVAESKFFHGSLLEFRIVE